MEVHQLKCPNCNANLEVEDNLDTFYCKYCEAKLLVTGQDSSTIRAKVEIRKAEIDADLEKTKQKSEYDLYKTILKWGMVGIIIGILAIIMMRSSI